MIEGQQNERMSSDLAALFVHAKVALVMALGATFALQGSACFETCTAITSNVEYSARQYMSPLLQHMSSFSVTRCRLHVADIDC